MFKLNTKCDADSLLYSVVLNAMATYTHAHSTVSTAPLTSTVMSSFFTHAHASPPSLLPGYVDVAQTVLIMLTMVDLFLDRPHIHASRGSDKLMYLRNSKRTTVWI